MIVPSFKKARLSAYAIGKSFNIPLPEARSLLANSFDLSSWDSLIGYIGEYRLKTVISYGDSDSYNQRLMDVFVQHFGIQGTFGLMEVAESVSPFSLKPRPLFYDLLSVKGEFEDLKRGVKDRAGFIGLIDVVCVGSGHYCQTYPSSES